MNNLERAIVIGTTFHRGQKDKSGEPYILHPLRVMLQMSTEEEMIVAVLHDVVEDTKCKLKELSRQFSEEIVEAIDSLTRREGEVYMDYVRRAIKNKLAKKVKLADLRDNMDPLRCKKLNDEEVSRRMIKYMKAKKLILEEEGET